MNVLTIIFHLAVSLFVAPTPGLMLLLYANGGGAIPPSQGLLVVLASVAAYWAWCVNRSNRVELTERQAAARDALIDRPEGFEVISPSASGQSAAAHETRQMRDAAIRGYEDLADPVAERRHQPPKKILIDRIADLRQLKRLVSDHETALLNAFHRTVARDQYGAPDYKEWAYEADRFLLSSTYAARTLNRHEAIATLTAEVEHLATVGRRILAEAAPTMASAAPAAHPVAAAPPHPVAAAPMPATELARYAVAPAPAAVAADDASLAGRLVRRMAEHRTRSFTEACIKILGEHGWQTQATDSPGVDAIDLFAERGDLIVGLRCRADEKETGDADVREVLSAQERFGLDSIGIVSRRGFTKQARALGAYTGVALLDAADLADLHLLVGQRRKTVVPLFKEAGQQG